MVEWPRVRIGDVAEVFDGPHATPKTVEHGPIFLGIGALQNGRINLGETRHVTEEDFKVWTRRVKPQPDDVVFSYETRLGEAALIPEGLECCLGRRMGLVRANRQLLNPRYFLFLYISPDYQRFIQSRTNYGATVDRIALKEFPSFEIPLPPLSEQNEIATTLGVLDDKIEVNRQMNKTLEAMAQTLFKDWFVDFGPTRAKMEGRVPYLATEIWSQFPARLDDTGKPEGWKSEPLSKVATFLNGLALQNYPPRSDVTLPVIKIAELRAASATNASQASADIPPQYVINDGDVIFSWSGSLLHRVWTSGRGALNQHLFKVTSASYPKWFFYHWIGFHMEEFRAIAASKATTMGHIQRHHLDQAMTIVPDDPILSAANELIGPLFEQGIRNDLESRNLAQTRDLLLPKLMSGEIRLREATKTIEAAL